MNVAHSKSRGKLVDEGGASLILQSWLVTFCGYHAQLVTTFQTKKRDSSLQLVFTKTFVKNVLAL